jgi:hypothetical protein
MMRVEGQIALVGIQAGDIAIGLDPTPPVAAGILVAADTVAAEIARIVAGPAGSPRIVAGPVAGSGQALLSLMLLLFC